MLRRSGLIGLGLGSFVCKNGGMGTGRTAGAKSIVESGVIWQGHSFVMGQSGEPKVEAPFLFVTHFV